MEDVVSGMTLKSTMLDAIKSPADLRAVSEKDLQQVADALRAETDRFAGLGALTLEGGMVPHGVQWVARLTPSGALTEALSQAMTMSVDWFGVAVLALWGGVAALCALRWFRFT